MKNVCILDILKSKEKMRNFESLYSLKNIKSNNKKGISLVVLIITIIVIIILASVTIVSTKNSIDNANITSLASDLKEVEDATEGYYLDNNKMPTPDDNTDSATKDQVITIAGTTNANDLSAEFTLNGDDTNAEFYPIDLNKIDVTSTSRGTKKKGDNDVFYIAYPSMDVYYLRGVSAKGQKFFSFSSKISKYTKIGTNSTIDTSTTEVLSSNGLDITKEKSWTNTMPLTIKTNMASDETLYISISSGTPKQIDTTTGQYNKSFSLTDLFATNSILKDSATFVSTDIASDKKYAEVIKKKNDSTIATIKIDLSKFDNTVPTVSNISTSSYTNMNMVMFDISDDLSGVSSIRYDYLTKIDSNGTEQSYYSGVTSFDAEYMKTKSKRAKLVKNQGTIILNLPKNVNQVSYMVEDNAGNYILQGTRVTPMIYISNVINSLTTTGFSITSNIYSTNGVSNVKYSYSTDGTTFSNEQSFDLNTNNTTTTQTVTFTGENLAEPFLKTIVTDNNATAADRKTDSSISIVKMKSQNISDDSIIDTGYNSEQNVNGPVLAKGMTPIKWNGTTLATTTTSDTSWYSYTASDKQWANAQTADGSMWVWIPRYEYQITSLEHQSSSSGGNINIKFIQTSQTTADSGYIIEPAFTFGNTQLAGIWVAKFEASGTTSAVEVKPDAASLRSITISDMFTACRNMESNTSKYGFSTKGVDTHLMKNVEWGSVAYLAQSSYGKNSEVTINSSSSYLTGNGAYASNQAESTTGNIYGIYDMSGGAWEYVAAYVNNGNSNLTTYGNSLYTADAKYKDVYTSNGDTRTGNYSSASSHKGDAVYETSSSGDGSPNYQQSWYSDDSAMPCSSVPFFVRGGYYYDGTLAGLFYFGGGVGNADGGSGFRPALAAEGAL